LGDVKSFRLLELKDSDSKKGIAFLDFENPELANKALIVLQGVIIEGQPLIIERHVRPATSMETPDYSVPQAAKNLLQKPSKVLEISGVVEDPKALAEKNYFMNVTHDIKIECAQFGRIKSIHIPCLRLDSRIIKKTITNSLSKKNYNSLSKEVDEIQSGLGKAKSCLVKSKSEIEDTRKHIHLLKEKIVDCRSEKITKLHGIGKVFVEFTRPEIARGALYSLNKRVFEGRFIAVRYFPLRWYQKRYHKGLVPVSNREKIHLSLVTQQKLMLSDVKCFPGVDLR
jgi:hypothetical protein